MGNLEHNIDHVLLSEDSIKGIVERLAAQITKDYENKQLLMVGILKGSMVFMADLMRKVRINAKIDFMSVSSYGSGITSSGEVRIIMDLKSPVETYDVLLVEDILDSGATLHYIKQLLLQRNPKSIRIVTLFDKPGRRRADIKADYIGTVVPDEFIVGYGLDFAEDYRNLPYIGVLKSEAYKND